MDDRLATQIFREVVGSGTGYAISANLILTARHVLHAKHEPPPAPGTEFDVRLWGDLKENRREWLHAKVLWYEDWDIALLEVTEDERVKSPTLMARNHEAATARSVGRLPDKGDFDCVSFGWPKATQRLDERQPFPFQGEVTGRGRRAEDPIRAVGTRLTPKKDADWMGMSGAALYIGKSLVGVVVRADDRFDQGVLEALPLAAIAKESSFWQHLGEIKIEDIEVPTEQLATFFTPVPSRSAPEIFVDRPEQTSPILARLLDPVSSKAGQVHVTAIMAMGGLGKSTTAAWLAWRKDVEKHFVDGRVWVTLGRKPGDARAILTDWLHMFGRPEINPNTIEGARGELGSLLKDKAVLFVIDDVWTESKETTDNLLIAAPRVRYLLTTRNPKVVKDLRVAGETFSLDVLSPTEALELLNKNLRRLKSQMRTEDETSALRLADTVGYHPLALELAAARVAKGYDWQKLTMVLSSDIAQLEKLESLFDRGTLFSAEDEDHRRYVSVRASLRLSLRELPDPRWQRWFAWFGVLAEKAPITPKLGATLWSVDQDDALEILGEFADLNLLSQEVTGRFRLHDLVHDLARSQLIAPEQPKHKDDLSGLGLTLEEASRRLLEAYSGNGTQAWHTLADDGYLYDHLAYHLIAGDLTPELHGLLSDQMWMHVRVPQRGYTYDGYIEDLSFGWKEAKEDIHTQIAAGEDSTGFIDLLRYTLIRAHINNLSANYVPGLVLRAVETNLWDNRRALSVASKIPDPVERVKMYVAILRSGKLSEEERASIEQLSLSTARVFGDQPYYEIPVLAELVPQLSGSLVEEGINLTLGLTASPWQSLQVQHALAQIASGLTGKMQIRALQRAVDAAFSIQDHKEKVYALLALVPMLAPKQQISVLDPAFDTAVEIVDPKERSHALAAVASNLTSIKKEAAITAGLDAARNVDDPKEGVHAYSAMATHLDAEDKTSWLREAFKKLPYVNGEKEQAYALDALSPHLTKALWHQAREAAVSINDPVWRAYALTTLARDLDFESRTEVLEEAFVAAKDAQEFSRGWLLATLAPLLKGSLLEKAIDAAHHITNSAKRAEALIGLAYAISGERQKTLIETALQATEEITDQGAGWGPGRQADFVAAMVPILTDDLIEKALNLTFSIAEPHSRRHALDALATKLTGSLLDVAINSALQIPRVLEQERALMTLFPYVAKKDQRYVLKSLDAILNDPDIRWSRDKKLRSYTDLARFTHGDLQNEVLQKGFRAGLNAMELWSSGEDLVQLVSMLTDQSLSWCLEAALALQDEGYRSQALAILATKLSDNLLEKARAAATAMEDEKDKAYVLTALASRFKGHRRSEVLHEAVEASMVIPDPRNRAFHLSQLLTQLQGEDRLRVLKSGLAAALKIDYERSQSYALASLAPHLEGELLEEAVAALLAMSSDWRADALAKFALKLPKKRRSELQKQALEAALRLQHKCGPSVQRVVNNLDEALLEYALDAILKLKDDPCYVSALAALAPHLTEELLSRAVDRVLEVQEEAKRTAALAELIPKVSGEVVSRILGSILELSDAEHRSGGTSLSLLGNRTQLLVRLAPRCTPDLSLRVLQAVSELETENNRVAVLKALAPGLRSDTFMPILDMLERTEELSTDWGRSEVLQTLSSHLPEDLVSRGIEIANHISDTKHRVQAILSFLPVAADQAYVLYLVRSSLLEHLESLQDEDRASVLSFYSNNRLFAPPTLAPDTLAIIARQIVEISDHWQWL